MNLYQEAAEIGLNLPILWSETSVKIKDKNYICLFGDCICPCGNMERLSVVCIDDKQDYRLGIMLHHGWHHACFKHGLDVETQFGLKRLMKEGQEATFKRLGQEKSPSLV